jgi:transcriptional regulator with XRE-family HTH domain
MKYRRDLTPELIRKIRRHAEFDERLLIDRPLTQKQFAELIGVDRTTVARWENIRSPLYPKRKSEQRLLELLHTIEQRRSIIGGGSPIFNMMGKVTNNEPRATEPPALRRSHGT